MDHIVGPIVLVLLVVGVPYFALWPSVRRSLIKKHGVPARGIVKSIATSAVRNDDTKVYDRDLVLEIHHDGKPPYDVRITQPMPWLSGPGMPGREYEVLVYPSRPSWVFVPEPKPRTLPA
jgi:hypothetical protein